MKAEWKTNTLGEVSAFINRGVSPKYIEQGGVSVLNQRCIREHSLNYEFARRHDITAKFVAEERFVRSGDVLVNSTGTGTLGRVAQLREDPVEPTTVDSHVTIVRPKPGIFERDFFGYMLVAIEDAIKAAGEGCGGQTELSRSVLANKFFVRYPRSLNEQRRIVSILDEAFAGLEAMRANAEKNLQNARAIFDSYLEGLFGGNSAGWDKAALQNVCEKITDGTHQTPKYSDAGHVFLSSRNVTSGLIDWENVKYIDNIQHVEMQRRVSPKIGDILLAKNGTTGVAAVVDKDIDFDIYVSLALLRPNRSIRSDFLLLFINSPIAKLQFNKRLKGVGVPNLHLKEIREVEISYPSSLKEQQRIAENANQVLANVRSLEALYTQKLAAIDELKQAILQKAFAGELTAAEAVAA